jgi:hypothetical protein
VWGTATVLVCLLCGSNLYLTSDDVETSRGLLYVLCMTVEVRSCDAHRIDTDV